MRITRIILSILLTGVLFQACSLISPYISALRKIENGQFDKASFQLSKTRRDSTVDILEAYAYTRHFSKRESPWFKLDSAIKWAHRGDTLWMNAEKWKKSFIRKNSSKEDPFHSLVLEIDSLGFVEAKERASEKAMIIYLDNFPDTRFSNRAVEIRDSLAFQDAKSENTYLSYKSFIEKYPNSRQGEEAREVYEFLLYETHTRDGHRSSYENFISKFPHSPYITEAQNALFKLYTLDGRVSSFNKYISTFPNSSKSDESRLWIKYLEKDYSEKDPVFVMPQKDLASNILINPFDSINSFFLDSIKFHNNCDPYRHEYLIYTINSKWGLSDRLGMGLIPPVFHDLEKLRNDLYMFSNGSKKGLVHVSGFRISDAAYEDIRVVNDTFLSVSLGQKIALAVPNGQILSGFEFDEIREFGNDILAFKKGKRWALCKGEEFLKWPDKPSLLFKHDSLRNYGNQLIISTGRDHSYFINPDLDSIETSAFQTLKITPYGLLAEKTEGLAFLDDEGKEIASKFDEYAHNDIGYAFRRDSTWNCIFFNNSIAADSFSAFNDYYARVFRNDSSFILTGSKLFPIDQFDKINTGLYNHNGIDTFCFVFSSNEKFGLLSARADTILNPEWDEIKVFDQSAVRVKKKGRFGLYDMSGKVILKPEYDAISNFSDGGLSLFKNSKFGFIHPGKGIFIKPEFDASLKLLNLKLPFFTISGENTLRLINQKGKTIAECKDFLVLNDSLVFFNENFRWNLMKLNADGEFQELGLECLWVSPFEDGNKNRHFLYKKETGMGFYDIQLNQSIYPEYYQIYPITDSLGELSLLYTFKYFEEINLFLLQLFDRNENEIYRSLISAQRAASLSCERLMDNL